MLLCCLFSQADGGSFVWAAEDKVDVDPYRLKLEKRLLSPNLPAKSIDGGRGMPAFVSADRIEGRTDDVTIAIGQVEVRKSDTRLYTDRLQYRPLDDEMEARGSVVLIRYDDEMRGPFLRFKLTEQTGFFDDVDYKVRRETVNRFYRPVVGTSTLGANTAVSNAPMMLNVAAGYGLGEGVPARRPTEVYGHSRRIDFEGENKLTLNDASYSSCRPGDMDWVLKADAIHLDYDEEEGVGDNSVLYFKDFPIFFTPYASFALNHRRKSGFLPPMLSVSTRNGLDVTLPYYWNLAPNYDLTIYPREIARRGLQMGGEGRYADFNFNGTTKLEYLPDDQVAHRDRWAYSLNHTHRFGAGLSGSLQLNGVSDSTYWGDLSTRLLQTSQSQLPKQLTLTYAPDSWWSSSLTWQRYQTLQIDPALPISRPYFIEPQIAFNGRLPDLRGLDVNLVGQYSYFTHPSLVDGGRTVVYPQISWPLVYPAFNITPKIGLHATQYSLQQQQAGLPTSVSRVIPTFSLDSTVVFERDMQWMGRDHVQTLEPRLFYVNIPYRDQSRIPVFDSGLADFNFAQIFSENRFVGYDRINDANQLTAALTSRVFDATTGAERFRLMVGQRYYFKDQRVLMPGEAQPAKRFSNSLLAFNGLVRDKTYLDSALEYNNHEGRPDRFSIGARYQPDNAKVISASYRYVRTGVTGVTTTVDQIDLAAQWPLGRRWHGVARYNYSIRDKQLLEAVGGVEYNAGCWAARFVAQRLEAVAGSPNTTFFFQLELNDFASLGSNPVQLLRRSVPGYGKINELPTSGSLLTSE